MLPKSDRLWGHSILGVEGLTSNSCFMRLVEMLFICMIRLYSFLKLRDGKIYMVGVKMDDFERILHFFELQRCKKYVIIKPTTK